MRCLAVNLSAHTVEKVGVVLAARVDAWGMAGFVYSALCAHASIG
jgi:hypothetical protein